MNMIWSMIKVNKRKSEKKKNKENNWTFTQSTKNKIYNKNLWNFIMEKTDPFLTKKLLTNLLESNGN